MTVESRILTCKLLEHMHSLEMYSEEIGLVDNSKYHGADCPDEPDVSKIINFSDYRSSAHIDAQQAEENVISN